MPRNRTGAGVNDRAAGARRAGLDYPGCPQSPVDLPLRLDDAGASPTTPQGPQQKEGKGARIRAERDEATGADLVRQSSMAREHSLVRQYVTPPRGFCRD